MNNIPPSSMEADQAVLGAVLIDREAFLKIDGSLFADDFYDPANGLIFQVIQELSYKGIPIDVVTIPDEMKNRDLLTKVGGLDYILQLATNTSTTANIEYYSHIIRDRSLQRKIIRAANSILGLDYSSTIPAEELLDSAEQMIMSLSENLRPMNFLKISDLLDDALQRMEIAYQKKSSITGIRTGYYDLDELTNGLQNSDLIILAARPSIGKTSLALNIATNVAFDTKIPVAIFSLEMSKEQLVERVICSFSEVNLQKFRTGNLTDQAYANIASSIGKIHTIPFYIDDTPDVSIMDVRSKARRLQAEKGTFLLIVDYLQLMHSQERVENRVQEISKITRQMKNLARELHIPIILLSQLSRDIEKRQDKKPVLSDLRESGAIEQDADIVMFLHRTDNEAAETELLIAKQRNGPTGKVNLIFDREFTKFRNGMRTVK
jgi:replicative DNA helicase